AQAARRAGAEPATALRPLPQRQQCDRLDRLVIVPSTPGIDLEEQFPALARRNGVHVEQGASLGGCGAGRLTEADAPPGFGGQLQLRMRWPEVPQRLS